MCGVLLGIIKRNGTVEVTNSFAVPFDEDKKSGVHFMDHSFAEQMYGMFKRVSAKEVIVGWYHSGGELYGNDIEIHQAFRKYTDNPVLLIVNVSHMSNELPVKAYLSKKTIGIHSVEEVDTFFNLDVTLVASGPEEVGVEHVLRDVQDQEHVPTLNEELRQKKIGLEVLRNRMAEIREYLVNVREGNMPLNQDILYLLQDVFNIMPDINTPRLKASLIRVMNNQTLSTYVASIVRSVLALDGLITNREDNLPQEEVKKPEDKKPEPEKAENENEEAPAEAEESAK